MILENHFLLFGIASDDDVFLYGRGFVSPAMSHVNTVPAPDPRAVSRVTRVSLCMSATVSVCPAARLGRERGTVVSAILALVMHLHWFYLQISSWKDIF